MQLENYILILFAFLPILQKYVFRLFTIQLKEYRLDRFLEYIGTPQGKSALIHKLFFVDILVFILLIYYLFVPEFGSLFIKILIGIFALETIFVIFKSIFGKILLPRITFRLGYITVILLLIELAYFVILDNLAIFLVLNFIFPLLFIGLAVFFSYPIVICIKRKKYKEASLISKRYNKPIKVGITGSYGKSSSKEYLSQILGEKFKVLSTPKNINTEVGISRLIIDKLSNDYDYFVAEMGAYKIGEIRQIGEIVNHKYGFLTAVGNQHLGLFGGIENTMKAKSEIALKVLENHGTLYINWDNKNIRKLKFSKKLNIVKYGTIKGCDARAKVIEIDENITKFSFSYGDKETTFKTNLIGNHNIINIAGVIAFCLDIGMKKSELKDIIINLKLPENTLELIQTKENLVLNDTYNLSEGGLFAGVETMNSFKNVNEKILVIDDILELGGKSGEIHFRIGKKLAKNMLVTKVLFVGVNYKNDFVKGLVEGGLALPNIVNDLDFVKKGDILIFEGRRAKRWLDRFVK